MKLNKTILGKFTLMVCATLLIGLATGCSSFGNFNHARTDMTVLSQNNYQVLKTGVEGTSHVRGFTFLDH